MSDDVIVLEGSTDVVVLERVEERTVTIEAEDTRVITVGEAGPPGEDAGPVVVTDTYAANLALSWAGVTEHRVTLSGNITLTFSGAADGQRLVLTLTQDATGGRAVTLPASVTYNDDIVGYTASSGAGDSDLLGFIYNAATGKYRLVALIKGEQ